LVRCEALAVLLPLFQANDPLSVVANHVQERLYLHMEQVSEGSHLIFEAINPVIQSAKLV
jgi:hypothetical protein